MGITRFFTTPKLPSVGDGDLAVVTGATSGIGEATARLLVDEGFRVVGTTRRPGGVDKRLPDVAYVGLDLGDPASIESSAAEILALGTPAVLVNNAGESQSGPFEELAPGCTRVSLPGHVIGHVDLTQRLLPAMRAAGRGRVVMVGSMLGSFPLGFRSSYVASKAAIKGFAASARRELAPFGVGLTALEPGAIATGLSARRATYVDEAGPYAAEFGRMLKKLNRNEASGISAERVAREILRPIRAGRPRPHYAVGSMAPAAFTLARVVPQQVVLNVISAKHDL